MLQSEVIEVPNSGGLTIQYVRRTHDSGNLLLIAIDCTISMRIGLATLFAPGETFLRTDRGADLDWCIKAYGLDDVARRKAWTLFQKQIAHPATSREECARALVAIDAWLEKNGGF